MSSKNIQPSDFIKSESNSFQPFSSEATRPEATYLKPPK